LVDTFPGFAQNSSEKRQEAACHFLKEFCEKSRKCANQWEESDVIQKRIVHALSCLQKSFANSEALCSVKQLRTYKPLKNNKGRIKKKKLRFAGRPSPNILKTYPTLSLLAQSSIKYLST
jgi:hypothetical protein